MVTVLARRPNAISDCPLTAAMAALGGKWKLIILYWLGEQPLHFAALKAKLGEISSKVLTDQLRELISDELVAREETGPIPAPVVYSLTDYGQDVLPLIEMVRGWGRGHVNRFQAGDAKHS